MMTLWRKYDENAVKTVSKCLARMKGYWDPEFKPSVEEIVDYQWYMAILSVHFLWRARILRDFPIQWSTWQVLGGGHVRVNRGSSSIIAYTEHAQFVDVSEAAYSRRSEHFS